MIESNKNARVRKKRDNKTLVVAPVARAVRAALAASAVFAMSAGAAAHAGVRAHDAVPAAYRCAAASIAPDAASPTPVDLTRVECEEQPTSVIASNANGAWGSDIAPLTEIDNGTDIHVSGYGGNVRALYAFDDSITIVNNADVTADASALAVGDYVAAIGVRAAGYDVEVHNDAYGLVGATAVSDAGTARARAVYATGYFDNVTVDNDGDIRSHAQADGGRADAHGIYAFGYGSATNVDNAGDIDVSAQAHDGFGYATGITSIGYGSGYSDAVVVNSGSIDASADAAYAYAFGVLNLTRQRYGNASFTNAGDIHAEATGDFATATGALNLALRYGNATTTNTGTIEAVANGTWGGSATGLYSYTNVYDASLDNSGIVNATATGAMAIAIGIDVGSSLYGSTIVVNSGDVAAHATGSTSFARAAGLVATSEKTVDVTNEGSIDVAASSVDGAAFALGMYGTGVETTTLRNYGDIGVMAESVNDDAIAYGAFEFAGYAGIGLMVNGGDIHVAASAGAGMQAHATGINVIGDVASVFNDANASATATAGDGGLADARAARAYGMYTAVSNYGALDATASADNGVASARGAESLGVLGSNVYNAGDIAASASAIGGVASATGAYSVGISFGATTTNDGTISAHAVGDQADVFGVLNASAYYGNAVTINTGSISAIAEGGIATYGEEEAISIGVYNFALLYDSVVDNSGSIFASASAMADISGTNGFLQAKAVGAEVLNAYAYGQALIANAGDIVAVAGTSQGYASAWGAAIQSSGAYGGTALIDNDGTISAIAHADIGVASATGAYALDMMADSQVVNHGDINAYARAERGIVNVTVDYAYATGVKNVSNYGTASVDNDGSIDVKASAEGAITGATGVQAFGAHASVTNAAGASITVVGEVDLFGGGFATGIQAVGAYGADVVNDGVITVYGHAHALTEGDNGFYGAAQATGIYAAAGWGGDVSVANNSAITAIANAEHSESFAQGGAGAVGISTYAGSDVDIVNAGDILAAAQAEFGITGAYGVIAHGNDTSHLRNEAGVTIVATAMVGSAYGDDYAGRAVTFGTHMFGSGMEQGVTINDGIIVSHATATADGANAMPSLATAFGSAVGAYSRILAGEVINHGDIDAAASAEFGYATTFGTYVRAGFESATTNTGRIRASATADNGNAFAVGSYAFALHQSVTYNCDDYGCDWANPIVVLDGGESHTDNSGDIIATAFAAGGIGYSYGAVALGAYAASITNTGSISAVTQADDALAGGVVANSFNGDAMLTNSGDIVATATGAITAGATGAAVRGANGAQLENAGRILAGAYGADATAIAVQMGDTGSNVLHNTGTIGAFGDGTRIAVSSGSGATANIVNGGSLIGALLTGDLDDSFDNAAGATWFAVGESAFGDGDDHVVNHGTLVMQDAAIRLGGYSAGNTFENFGTIAVSGDANVLDMDNPFPVYNNGVIDFVDGAPDDVLTILGDFAGAGAITLDVGGLHQVGDRLYIDGSVIEPTVQTLNLNLLDLPTTASVDIPLVQVGGDSLAGNFVLGQVQSAADDFFTMDFRLNADIDASNASRDIVSLGVEVTGLNDFGSLAAGIASGAQSLVDAQIGTWRQRMGVVPRQWSDGGIAPWGRVFSNGGDVELDHRGNFGAGGNFGFEQSNHGWEIGLDTRPGEHFAFGLLIADAEGTQRLDGGNGRDRFDGTSFGVYGTGMAGNGLYVDVSLRWTGIDARLSSAMGQHRVEASAASFNVEAGFTAWTMADGINVVPQAQYTRTRISDITPLQSGPSDFASDGGTSSRGRLGVAFDKHFERAGFTWTPYGSINAIHEFDGVYDYAINGGLLGSTSAEGTSAMVELGVGAEKGGLSITGGFNWTDGGAMQGVGGGQLIVRYSW